jgi:hypothetical protein
MRLKGHKLTHIAYLPPHGWIWECECRHKVFRREDTKATAHGAHLEHKLRVVDNAQHDGVDIYRTRDGLRARCFCGHDLGINQTPKATDAAHAEHRASTQSNVWENDHE